tara:strand:+ start:998 stop:1975 length:978 start_codon:yes stop_codon:yes gene_type:complete
MAEPSNPEYLLDRRRLRRKLTFWRVTGLGLLAVVLIWGVARLTGLDPFSESRGQHIAEISVDGLIVGSDARLDLIDELGKQDNVRAVIVKINSPGGTTSGGEALYESLRALSEKKPVVATIDGIGTSAAYMAALATDRIFARRASITGSIGVIYQSPNVTALLDKLGIRMEEIKSDPLKASPNPFSPTSPEARAVIQDLIDDSYEWFLDLVKERRNFDEATARTLADGRVYSGDRALSVKLIDAIGSQDDARDWLITEYNLDSQIKVIEREISDDEPVLSLTMRALFVTFAKTIGLGGVESAILDAVSAPTQLDGLISVWHPILD